MWREGHQPRFLYSPDRWKASLVSDDVIYVALAASLMALGLAAFYARFVMAASPGNERMVEISAAIREGSMAFLRREYTWVSFFVRVLALLIGFLASVGSPRGPGPRCSEPCCRPQPDSLGFESPRPPTVGRPKLHASGGAAHALPLAFRGGAVMGFTVAGLGLLGLVVGYLVTNVWLERSDWPQIVTAIGLGGSSVALFARVGGGIFTKAADIGADLVGQGRGRHPRGRSPQPGGHRRQRR